MQVLGRNNLSGARVHARGSLTPALITSVRRTWVTPKAQVPSSTFSPDASVKGIQADGIVEKLESSRAPAWWSPVISACSKAAMLFGIAAVVVSGPLPIHPCDWHSHNKPVYHSTAQPQITYQLLFTFAQIMSTAGSAFAANTAGRSGGSSGFAARRSSAPTTSSRSLSTRPSTTTHHTTIIHTGPSWGFGWGMPSFFYPMVPFGEPSMGQLHGLYNVGTVFQTH